MAGVAKDAHLRFGVFISQSALGGEKRDQNKISPEIFCFYIMGRVVVVAVALGIGHGSGNQTKLTPGQIMCGEIMTPKSPEIMEFFSASNWGG